MWILGRILERVQYMEIIFYLKTRYKCFSKPWILCISECQGPFGGLHCLVHGQTSSSEQDGQPCGPAGPLLPPGPGRRKVRTAVLARLPLYLLEIVCVVFIYHCWASVISGLEFQRVNAIGLATFYSTQTLVIFGSKRIFCLALINEWRDVNVGIIFSWAIISVTVLATSYYIKLLVRFSHSETRHGYLALKCFWFFFSPPAPQAQCLLVLNSHDISMSGWYVSHQDLQNNLYYYRFNFMSAWILKYYFYLLTFTQWWKKSYCSSLSWPVC